MKSIRVPGRSKASSKINNSVEQQATAKKSTNNKYTLPLKIVINGKYIGAIIGHGGGNIRDISKSTKTECVVDVNNSAVYENGNPQKVVWIRGTLENCEAACVKILEIVQKEMGKDRQAGDNVVLKLLAQNQLIGRLIGKGGSSIKKIIQETNTTITTNDPSSVIEFACLFNTTDSLVMDRIITIRANSIENVANAAQKILSKLRTFYEADVKIYLANHVNTIFNNASLLSSPPLIPDNSLYGLPTLPTTPTSPYHSLMGCQTTFPMNTYAPIHSNSFKVKSRIYVPSMFIGSIIGTKGSYIRRVMYSTSANIRIEGEHKSDKHDDIADNNGSNTNNDFTNKDGGSVPKVTPVKEEKKKNEGEKVEEEVVDEKRNSRNNEDSKNIEEEEKDNPKKSDLEEKADNGDKKEDEKKVEKEENCNEKKKIDKEEAAMAEKKDEECTMSNINSSVDSLTKKKIEEANEDRCVMISGYDFQVYQAQYYVFQKIAEITRSLVDELVLTSEAVVPRKIVGRIIGKNGRNVRELQYITQAQVKVPDEQEKKPKENVDPRSEAVVQVVGTFFSLQAVQARFCSIVAEYEAGADI